MAAKAGRYDEVLFSTRGTSGTIYALNADTVQVEVFESDGTTNATLYDDRDKTAYSGTGSIVEPDAAGNIEFFADPGIYVLKISDDGTELRTDTVNVSVDGTEASALGWGNGELVFDVTHPDFGATGDGSTDDRAAFQAAIDAAPDGGIVFVPTPETHFLIDGSLDVKKNITLYAGGRYGTLGSSGTYHLVGNGTDPVITTGAYPGGSSTTHRRVHLYNLTIRNTGAKCIELHHAHNARLHNCVINSFSLASGATIEGRDFERGVIRDCEIGASGGAWAIDLQDNCNGTTVASNIISGGSLGGAVNVGQCQAVAVRDNVIESSLVGVVGGKDAGICNALVIDHNYIESCRDPISVGEVYRCAGGSISNNYISNGSATFTPNFGLQIGRLAGVRVEDNYVDQKGAEPAVNVLYEGTAAGSTPAPEGCRIGGTFHTGSSLYDLTDYSNDITRATFAGKNTAATSIDGSAPPAGRREWVSDVIDASAGLSQVAIALDTTYGGWVDGVDIIESSGTLGCTVDVGTSSSATEIASFDPSGLSYTTRSATQNLDVGWRVGAAMLARVTSGAGTGTFRIRVRWHGA